MRALWPLLWFPTSAAWMLCFPAAPAPPLTSHLTLGNRIRPSCCSLGDEERSCDDFDLGLLKLPRLTTPQRRSYEQFRERQRSRTSGERSAADIEAAEKAELMTDALLLGVSPEDLAAERASFFRESSSAEAASNDSEEEQPTEEDLKQEAERDAAQWQGTESALAGESELSSFTEVVTVDIDEKTGKYDARKFDV